MTGPGARHEECGSNCNCRLASSWPEFPLPAAPRVAGAREAGGGLKGQMHQGSAVYICRHGGALITALCRLLNVGPVSWSARTSGSTTGFFSDLTIVCLGSAFFHNYRGFLD